MFSVLSCTKPLTYCSLIKLLVLSGVLFFLCQAAMLQAYGTFLCKLLVHIYQVVVVSSPHQSPRCGV